MLCLLCSLSEKLLLKTGNICQRISKTPSCTRTVIGAWVKSTAYSRVQDAWISKKHDDFECTYIVDEPKNYTVINRMLVAVIIRMMIMKWDTFDIV